MKHLFHLAWIFLFLQAVSADITHMCDFEMDDCEYMNDETDNYDWRRRRLVTGSILTGPLGDHTTGLGSFMYADASDGKIDSVARVMTPLIEGSTGTPTSLLTFWFSMWSVNPREMGTLNVYLMYSGVMNPTPIWSTSGVQNGIRDWVEAKLLITTVEEYQIVFESIRGRGERSDIAIDDVSVINADIPATCDFEDSEFGPLCTFYQELIEDDFDWTWHSGETPTLGTGPLNDHTIGNITGHYLYMEATRDERQNIAQLKTYPMFKDGGRCTMRFYYHAYGEDLGGMFNPPLTVSVSGDLQSQESVGGSGTSNPEWREATISIPQESGSYQVTIQARRTTGNSADVAIDDVSFGIGCIGIDKCASNPCWNGGTCTQTASQYICECVPGYTGLHCQFDENECESNPCSDGRVCADRVNGYECVCEEGYTGEDCGTKIEVPGATEVIPKNAYRTPVIIGSTVMAVGVLLITLLIGCCCRTTSGKGSSLSSGSIQNPPTAKELAMRDMSSENSAYDNSEGSSASSAKDDTEEMKKVAV